MGQVVQCHAFTASLQTMIIHEVDMYTSIESYSVSASPCSTLAGARHDIVSLCVAVGWFALVAHGSGRAGRLCSLPTAPSVTLRTFRVRGVTRTEKRVYLKRKKVTSDDAVTCQNIPHF